MTAQAAEAPAVNNSTGKQITRNAPQVHGTPVVPALLLKL